MSRAALRVLGVVAVLGAAVAGVVLLDNRSVVPTPELSDGLPGIEGARLQIAADSQRGVREARVQAAPIVADSRSASVEPFSASAPAAPDGYSFTTAPTELSMAAYRPTSERDAGTASAPGHHALDWLFGNGGTGNAPLAAVADLAQRMRRDWTFGWLRLADGAKAQDVRNAVAPLGIDVLAASGAIAAQPTASRRRQPQGRRGVAERVGPRRGAAGTQGARVPPGGNPCGAVAPAPRSDHADGARSGRSLAARVAGLWRRGRAFRCRHPRLRGQRRCRRLRCRSASRLRAGGRADGDVSGQPRHGGSGHGGGCGAFP